MYGRGNPLMLGFLLILIGLGVAWASFRAVREESFNPRAVQMNVYAIYMGLSIAGLGVLWIVWLGNMFRGDRE